MKSRNHPLRLVPLAVVALFAASLAGCVSTADREFAEAPGAYGHRYQSGLAGWKMPPVEAIRRASRDGWLFHRPIDEVWKACLEVVSQYHGVIGIEKGLASRTLCAIRGRDAQIAATDRFDRTIFGSCYEQWLVIGLSQESRDTRVSLAVLDPNSGRLDAAPEAEQALLARLQVQLNSIAGWKEKFIDDVPPPGRSQEPIAAGIAHSSGAPFEDYEVVMGDLMGKRLRLELGVVHCPEVTDVLEAVARRLEAAAEITGLPVLVRILASPSLNAFALPNGEIYVSSGLLDSSPSLDGVAAVLAHEISHLKHHDVAARLKRRHLGETGAAAAKTAWALAEVALQFMGSPRSLGTTLGRTLAENAVGAAIHQGADHLETEMLENFSADIELRADAEGCELLARAGFDVEANLAMLTGVQQSGRRVLDRQSSSSSSWINLKPGLRQRIEQMNEVIARIRANEANAKRPPGAERATSGRLANQKGKS